MVKCQWIREGLEFNERGESVKFWKRQRGRDTCVAKRCSLK